MRKKFIIGNWKMNLAFKGAEDLAKKIKTEANGSVDVGICPPSIYLQSLSQITKNSNVQLGAQNMYHETSGAFTGEISPLMLKDCSVDMVIIGHSERREVFGESDELINKKVKTALNEGLLPIVCVGESLETREKGKEVEWVKNQITKALNGLTPDDLKKIVVAYEPIWAIGTGKVCNASDANIIISMIRGTLKELSNDATSNSIQILYGGSVKSDNFAEIIAYDDIDGGLVGGASLKADEFIKLIQIAEKAQNKVSA